ncbi:MAG: hypothetical protein AB7H97_08440, partial [Pseudobdellovibrionaceae bacterium]
MNRTYFITYAKRVWRSLTFATHDYRYPVKTSILLSVFLAVNACDSFIPPSKSTVNSVRNRGDFVVLTKDSSLTYSESKLAGPYGFEYDLASSLADYYNLNLKVKVFKSNSTLMKTFKAGEDDIAASRVNLESETA